MKQYTSDRCTFTLPEEWKRVPDPELACFTSPDERFRLTISSRPVDTSLPRVELSKLFTEFVRVRRAYEYEVGKVILSEENIVDGGSYWYSKFAGIHPGMDEASDRRLAALITLEAGKLLTFYIEAYQTSDQDFNALSNSLFNSIEVT